MDTHTQVWPKSYYIFTVFHKFRASKCSRTRQIQMLHKESEKDPELLTHFSQPLLVLSFSALRRVFHTSPPSLRWWLFILRVLLWWLIFMFILIFRIIWLFLWKQNSWASKKKKGKEKSHQDKEKNVNLDMLFPGHNPLPPTLPNYVKFGYKYQVQFNLFWTNIWSYDKSIKVPDHTPFPSSLHLIKLILPSFI